MGGHRAKHLQLFPGLNQYIFSISASWNLQVVDVTTMYLAKSLGLNVKTLKNSYTYNTNVSLHSFPNGSNSPSQTYIPENEANYPNLEQTYWSIMDQYTNITEPTIHEDKDKMWCSHRGLGMYEHCKTATAEVGSGCGGSSSSARNNHCKDFWLYFMEACNRVHSRDPTDSKYRHNNNVQRYCTVSSSSNSIYWLFRNWNRACPELSEKIYSLSNNTLATGFMELVGAPSPFKKNYRVAGTTLKYQCSDGFALPDGSNPQRELQCPGSLIIDRTQVTLCERKQVDISPFHLVLLQQRNVTLVVPTWALQLEQLLNGPKPSLYRFQYNFTFVRVCQYLLFSRLL